MGCTFNEIDKYTVQINLVSLLKNLYERSGVDWEAVKYKGSKSYCCYDNKKFIGYCQVLDDYTICNLVVDREYRGQGVASELLRKAISEGAKYLGCLKSNVRFYVNRGFKVYYVEYSKEFGANLYYMMYKPIKNI
jgi:ribosomal protein S18 acetylase RimI-like enzyme